MVLSFTPLHSSWQEFDACATRKVRLTGEGIAVRKYTFAGSEDMPRNVRDDAERVVGVRRTSGEIDFYLGSLHHDIKLEPGESIVVQIDVTFDDDGTSMPPLAESYAALRSLDATMQGAVEAIFLKFFAAGYATAGHKRNAKIAA